MLGNRSQNNNVTLTCHLIDHTGELHNLLLSTTEMQKRHTAENVRNHIQKEIVQWGLHSDIVTTNFHSTNANDIEDEAEAIDGEVDYLQEVGYYREEEEENEAPDNHLTTIISNLIDMEEEYSQNTTQISKEDTQDITQISQDEPDHSNMWNVVLETLSSVKPKPTLSFTTDNAKDITKALKGCYQWLGCSAHNINLVIKEAFLKNKTAALLLKKCKKICFIN